MLEIPVELEGVFEGIFPSRAKTTLRIPDASLQKLADHLLLLEVRGDASVGIPANHSEVEIVSPADK